MSGPYYYEETVIKMSKNFQRRKKYYYYNYNYTYNGHHTTKVTLVFLWNERKKNGTERKDTQTLSLDKK